MLVSILGLSMAMGLQAQPQTAEQNHIKVAVEQFGHAPQDAQEFDVLISEVYKKLKGNTSIPSSDIERWITEIYGVPPETIRQWLINNFLNPGTRSKYLSVPERFMNDPEVAYSIRQLIRLIEANRHLAEGGVIPDELLAWLAADTTLHPRTRRRYARALDDPKHRHANHEDLQKMLRQAKGEEPTEGNTPEERERRRFEVTYLLLTLPPDDPDAQYYGLTEEQRQGWTQYLLNKDPLAQLDAVGDPIDIGRRAFLEAVLNDNEEEGVFSIFQSVPANPEENEKEVPSTESASKTETQAQDTSKASAPSPQESSQTGA
jgi:hypothetical protein